jgi:hypothetical protein
MKGEGFEIPINMLMMVVGMIGIFMLVVMIYANMAVSVTILEASRFRLNAIDATHAVEFCLKNGGPMIEEKFLDENPNTNICELCGICEVIIQATVRDVDTGEEWKFDHSKWNVFWNRFREVFKAPIQNWKWHVSKNMLTSLRTESGEIHMGRIYVWA